MIAGEKRRSRTTLAADKVTTIARLLSERGFSESDIDRGLSYASQAQASTIKEAFTLAISRIRYSDLELSGGMRFRFDEA